MKEQIYMYIFIYFKETSRVLGNNLVSNLEALCLMQK